MEEIEQIHRGELPNRQAQFVSAKGKRLSKQALRRGAITALPVVVVFSIAAATPGARENGTSLTILLLGLGFMAGITVIGQLSFWFKYGRRAQKGVLRTITKPAIKEPGYKVTFGLSGLAPHWHFTRGDFDAIVANGFYNVYYCADMLVYLEEVDEA